MVTSIILISVGMVLMSVFIYGKITNYSMRTVIIKTLTSILFVDLAVYLFAASKFKIIGLFFIFGAFFGLLGDVVLGLKRVYTQHDKLFTFLGFVSFAIGHIFYVSGLYTYLYIPGNYLYILIPLLIALVIGSLVLVVEKVLHVSFGKLKIVAFIYLTILSSLSLCSGSLSILYQFKSIFLILVFVGGLLFALSDLILSRTYFRSNPKKIELILCSVTYYFAQFLIAFSLFFI